MSDTPASTTAATPGDSSGPVTVAITRRVRPEDELLMRAWADAGTQMATHFPGFLGSGWVRPSTSSTDWHMLYRFDSRESLARWQESTERNRWLAAGTNLVEDTRVEHRTGIEGWFDEPDERAVDDLQAPAAPAAPPRWKQATVIWLAFFPTSLALAYLLGPLTNHWPVVLRVLLTTLIATPWMTYLLLPRVTKLFQPWLTRTPSD
ncbi:antibiotic biosynthesis monooxygenase [Knoellia subterranea]|uniref:Antibiotic biosynthesis monooxygenase n=1 Tax=Knoellia subterranea KCTC 19937 TaxID=1385521 RepID=A0A0A0JI06_9MICO|nr:antibiotic biosynthesis monooxygenase [Knoellia subterranea]KGN36763.1 antibiotic biosynthesis monooxygenase [Knoellia subterranea KCTC 19937]